MCRGTHTWNQDKKHESTHSIPIVARGCAPQHYLICNQEYNFDQMMESTCICHPLYAVENKNFTNNFTWESQCLPMAGVPCSFDRDQRTEFGRLLFAKVQCAPNMNCTSLKEINKHKRQNKSNWELFEKTFAGFGMSPIARDYMVSRATGMCVCEKVKDVHGNMVEKYIQTPFNECLEPVKARGEMIHFRQGGWTNGGKELLIGILIIIMVARNFIQICMFL